MSIRHPDYTDRVERITDDKHMTEDDRRFMADYAHSDGVSDLLDGTTRELIEEGTGWGDVFDVRTGARALLAEYAPSTA